MKKDLKSFLKGKGKNVDAEPKKDAQEDQREMAKKLKEQAKQFEGKSENELINQLLASVEQGKKDGTFSDETLQQFVSNVAPMMNPEQRKKLDELVKKIT